MESTAIESTDGITVYSEDFDDGVANGFRVSSTNPDVYWSVQSKRSSSGTSALYAGNPDSWSYDFGTTSTNVVLPRMPLPHGKITLRFTLWADVEDQVSWKDRLFVIVVGDKPGQALQPMLFESTDGEFITAEYDISEHAGGIVTIWFFFNTEGSKDNAGEGMYVDDIEVFAVPYGICL